MPMSIEIKDGKHQSELGVVIEEMPDGRLKTLTLEGDIHYYDKDGKEQAKPVGGKGQWG